MPIQLVGIPGRYVSSQQSSIVQYLNGGPAKPTFSPPRPHERGVNGKPTLVHNVETLAHMALIARRGDRWFRGAGPPSAPGSMLVTVSGAVARPGVYEIEMGMRRWSCWRAARPSRCRRSWSAAISVPGCPWRRSRQYR